MVSNEAVRGIRIYAVVLIVLTVVAGAAAAYSFLSRPPLGESADTKRYEYQQELNASKKRFTPGFDMIVIDGRAYIRTDYRPRIGHCDIRCGTVEKTNGSWVVSLPVGYTHGNNVVPDPESWEPVGTLTFWDPIARHVKTVTADTTSGKGILLPKFLLEYRKANDLRPGEEAYTTADFVRDGCDDKIYMVNGAVGYELLGEKYGYTFDTVVIHQEDGTYTVKLPDDKRPLPCRGSFNRDNTVPVTVVQ